MNPVQSLFKNLTAQKHYYQNKGASVYRRLAPDMWFTKAQSQLKQQYMPSPKLLAWKNPIVALETTDICNLNCLMCDTSSARRQKGLMTVEHFEQHVKILKSLNQRVVRFDTIGDPLVDKYLPERLKICHEADIHVRHRTNGLLLHRFIDDLIKYPPIELLFSIDGATKETYEKIRVNGKYEDLINNLDLVTREFKKHKVRSVLGVKMTICDDNVNEIPLFYDIFSRYFDEQNMEFGIVNSLAADQGSFFKKNGRTVDALMKWTPPCSQPFQTLQILHDQRVSACCRDYHGELIVGDLKTESLDEIWRGKTLGALREKHRNAIKKPGDLPRSCQTCYDTGYHSAELNLYIHYLILRHLKYNRQHPFSKSNALEKINEFLREKRNNHGSQDPELAMINEDL